MEAEPGRRFLKQPAEKLKAVFVAASTIDDDSELPLWPSAITQN